MIFWKYFSLTVKLQFDVNSTSNIEEENRHLDKTQVLILDMLSKLRMHDTKHGKIRIGTKGDGGYVVPDDLSGVKGVVSIGIGKEVSFDLHFAQRNIIVVQYDHTIEHPPFSHENFVFNKLGWAAVDSKEYISLQTIVDNNFTSQDDLLLKFDVENAEWDALSDISPELLNRFRIIVCELHGFDNISNSQFFNKINRVISILTNNHKVVHIHPNNCCGVALISGVVIPRVIEFTLLRNDRAKFTLSQDMIPSKLDYPNIKGRPEIVMSPFSLIGHISTDAAHNAYRGELTAPPREIPHHMINAFTLNT